MLRFLCEHLGRGASTPPPPRPALLSRAASGLGLELLLGTGPVAAAVVPVAWSPDAAGLSSGAGAGAQHVRRCEGVFGLDKLPSWAQYDAKVRRKYVYSRRTTSRRQGTGRGDRRPAALHSLTNLLTCLGTRRSGRWLVARHGDGSAAAGAPWLGGAGQEGQVARPNEPRGANLFVVGARRKRTGLAIARRGS